MMLRWIIERLFGDDNPEASAIACLTAMVGIFSGYALFLLWWEDVEKGESARTFVWALLAAAAMSLAFEFLRGVIEGKKHPWTRSRIISTVVMLAGFELFIIAIHDTVQLNIPTLVSVAGYVYGDQFGSGAQQGANLVALGCLWLLVALIIVFKLRKFVTHWPYPNSSAETGKSLSEHMSHMAPDLWRGAKTGLRAGAVWGPVSAGVYVILLRGYFIAETIHNCKLSGGNDCELSWTDWIKQGQSLHLPQMLLPFFAVPTAVVGWAAAQLGPIGAVVAIVALTAVVGTLVSKENRPLAMCVPAVAVFLLLCGPILADRGARLNLIYLFWMSVVVWGVPATLLGFLAPFLRRPARHPSVWGFVGCAAAAVLMLVTVARFQSGAARGEVFLLVAATIALLGSAVLLFLRGWSEEFWLSVALSIGMIIWGTTGLLSAVNLLAMQKLTHSLVGVELGAPAPSEALWAILHESSMNVYSFSGFTCKPLGDPSDSVILGPMILYGNLDCLRQFDENRIAAVDHAKEILRGTTPGTQISEVTARIARIDAVRTSVTLSKNDLATIDAITRKNPDAMSQCAGQPGQNIDQNHAPDLLFADLKRFDSDSHVSDAKLEIDRPCIVHQLLANFDELERTREYLVAQRNDLQLAQAQHLELTMTSSLGFWLTIGLLAIWRLTRPDPD
jgi:hypothetical protein